MVAHKTAKITWNGAKILARQHTAAVKGLTVAAEHILQVSRTQVPIEEKTLEQSGTVTVDEGKLRAAISYDTPYAVRQHEDLTLQHDDGRKAKYLEDPMRSEADTAMAIIAAQIRRALK